MERMDGLFVYIIDNVCVEYLEAVMKKQWIFILVLLLLATAVCGCGNNLPAVYVQSVNEIMGYGTAGEFNICSGIVVAQNETKIEKDADRKVAEQKVEVGQSVSAGDVLFVYDMEDAKLTIDKAELELEQLKNSVTDLEEQIKEVENEKKYAPSSEQLSYTIRIQTLETDKLEAEYNISVKERELESMKSTVGDGEVKAPVSGKVKSINENGAVDEMTGAPLPYIVLIEEGAYRIKGTVNELNRGDFFEGQSVVIHSRIDDKQTWQGTVELIESTPDNSQDNNMYYYGATDEMTSSSNYPFYVQLESTDGLVLGQHVYIEPDGGQENDRSGLWLSASYIMGSEEEGYYVWAADDDEIEKREVQIGSKDEELYLYEIVSGLSGTDLIAFPEDSIEEGAPITQTPVFEENNGGAEAVPQDGGFG